MSLLGIVMSMTLVFVLIQPVLWIYLTEADVVLSVPRNIFVLWVLSSLIAGLVLTEIVARSGDKSDMILDGGNVLRAIVVLLFVLVRVMNVESVVLADGL